MDEPLSLVPAARQNTHMYFRPSPTPATRVSMAAQGTNFPEICRGGASRWLRPRLRSCGSCTPGDTHPGLAADRHQGRAFSDCEDCVRGRSRLGDVRLSGLRLGVGSGIELNRNIFSVAGGLWSAHNAVDLPLIRRGAAMSPGEMKTTSTKRAEWSGGFFYRVAEEGGTVRVGDRSSWRYGRHIDEHGCRHSQS